MEFNNFIFFKRNQHYIPLLKLFTFMIFKKKYLQQLKQYNEFVVDLLFKFVCIKL